MNNILNSIVRVLRHQTIRLVANHRALLLHEADKITGFMKLLMKPRNTQEKWTREEKKLLRMHLKHLSYYVPVLIILVMPFGSLLIPLLAEILDRRRNSRRQYGANIDEGTSRVNMGS